MSACYDAIVVLGAGVTKKGNLPRVARARVDKAIELYINGAAQRIILSGRKEAMIMKRFAARKGVSRKDLLLENSSVDTIGNAFFTKKKFLQPRGWHRIVVVTSPFHLTRAKLVFRKILGNDYAITFAAPKKVLAKSAFRKKVGVERSLLMLTRMLSALVADGDSEAVENFLKKNPLYRPRRKSLEN